MLRGQVVIEGVGMYMRRQVGRHTGRSSSTERHACGDILRHNGGHIGNF